MSRCHLPRRVWARVRGALPGLVLFLADLGAFVTCVLVAYLLRTVLLGPVGFPRTLAWSGIAWLALRLNAGLYPGYGLWPPEELRRIALTTCLAGLSHAALLFGLRLLDASRLVSLVGWVLLIPCAWLARAVAKQALIRRGLYACPVVILGTRGSSEQLVRALKADRGIGFLPVAAFDADPGTHGSEIEGVPVLGHPRDALGDAVPREVTRAIVVTGGLEGGDLATQVRALLTRYRHVGIVADTVSQASLCVRPVSLGRWFVLELQNNLADPASRAVKRVFDVAVSLALLPVVLPAVLAAGAAVKLASPGPAFYSQWREGAGGRPIRVWKVRTMWPDAEERLERFLAANPEARAEWLARFKLKEDPRVIPVVGGLLRRWSIDELPQLWNVLRGEMSLVGPRAFPEYHLARFPEEFRHLRRQVPPGITGLWQVTTRADGDLAAQMDADSFYIRNWSVWMDLWILFRTAGAVLRGRGAY